MSCQASLLWSAIGWQSSLHLPHFTIALHLLNLCSAKKILLWEHIFFWLPALIFWRKCLKLFTVFFSKFGCRLKSFLQNVSDGNILPKSLQLPPYIAHGVSQIPILSLTVVINNYYLCISFCVASRSWHEKHFSMGGRVSGLLRISRGGTEEGFVTTKLRPAFDWLLWGHLWESSWRDSFLGGQEGVCWLAGTFPSWQCLCQVNALFCKWVSIEARCALLSLSPDGSLGILCDPVSP